MHHQTHSDRFGFAFSLQLVNTVHDLNTNIVGIERKNQLSMCITLTIGITMISQSKSNDYMIYTSMCVTVFSNLSKKVKREKTGETWKQLHSNQIWISLNFRHHEFISGWIKMFVRLYLSYISFFSSVFFILTLYTRVYTTILCNDSSSCTKMSKNNNSIYMNTNFI